jgi:hypothetical protein
LELQIITPYFEPMIQTNMTNNLNENETLILKAIVDASYKYTRGCFTYFNEVIEFVNGLSQEQVKGYISQLTQKNYILMSKDENGDYQITPGMTFELFTQYQF